jgi:predicted RND superfamily exporter protein
VCEVNQTAAIIYSVSLGLVVDDTIHIMNKYLVNRRQGLPPEESIRQCFQSVGVALTITTTALSGGLMAMLFSDFIPNMTTAVMLAGILIIALVYDLMFLPTLLLFIERFRTKAQRDPAGIPL